MTFVVGVVYPFQSHYLYEFPWIYDGAASIDNPNEQFG